MRISPGPSLRRLLVSLLVLTAGLEVAGTARAQFNGDPFDPYRAAYRSSTIPMGNPAVPGRIRNVTPPGLGTVPGIGVPWDIGSPLSTPLGGERGRFDRFGSEFPSPVDDIYRQYDEEFGRVYQPNAEADSRFAEAQQMRQELYFQASRETDPDRRAELMKQYRDLSRRISLGMSRTSSRTAQDRQTGDDSMAAGRRASPGSTAGDLPQTVRSYEDLVRWSRRASREALRVGVVRSGAN